MYLIFLVMFSAVILLMKEYLEEAYSKKVKKKLKLLVIFAFLFLGVLPSLFFITGASQKTTQERSVKMIKIKDRVFMIDNLYNKTDVTDDIATVQNGETNVIKTTVTQDSWFIDEMTPDSITYKGIVNVNNIEEIK